MTKASDRKISVIGHRGASAYEPENTLSSFDLAIAQGVDALEFDVNLTRDDVPVIIHDTTLERTTDGSGKVREKSLAQVKKLNAAAKALNHRFESVPTLEEVVGRYHEKMRLMVEIKYGSSFFKGIERKVISILENSDAIDDCEIISFDFDCIRKVRAIRSDVSTGIIFSGKISDFTRIASEIGCSALHPSYDYITKDDMLQTRKGTRLEVYTWTVNDLEEIRHQCEVIRPNGILTDYPDLALRVVRRFLGKT